MTDSSVSSQTRTCYVCRITDTGSLLRSRCSDCQKKYYAEWRKKNAARKKLYDADYYQLNAERIRLQVRERYQWNREEILELTKEYIRVRPEVHLNHNRAYRARLIGTLVIPFTREQLDAKMQYWGNRCWICKGLYEQLDHVKPLSKGGPHILANFRPICKSCNCSKNNTWPLEKLI